MTVAAFVDAADEDEEASAVGVTAIAEVGVAVGFDTGDTVGVTEGVDAEDLYTTATGKKVLMHPQAVCAINYSVVQYYFIVVAGLQGIRCLYSDPLSDCLCQWRH